MENEKHSRIQVKVLAVWLSIRARPCFIRGSILQPRDFLTMPLIVASQFDRRPTPVQPVSPRIRAAFSIPGVS